MNQSQDAPILMCCLHCKKLLLITNQIFSMLNENSSISTINSNDPDVLQPKHIAQINFTISESSQNLDRISTAVHLLQSPVQHYFPLCKDCSAIFLHQIGNSICIFQNSDIQLSDFSLILSLNPNLFSQHMNKLLELKTELTNNSPKHLVTPRDPVEAIPEENSQTVKSPKTSEKLLLLCTLKKRLPKFCPLIGYDTFFISTNRFYGTINGLRIGFYKYDENTVHENNLAFCQICHLISLFKNAFQIPQIHIFIRCAGIQLDGEKQPNLLEVPSKKKAALLGRFNTALEKLFTAYTLIEAATPQVENFSYETYKIDLNQKTISNTKFVLDWKHLEEWSVAMKFLLINLKILQCRSILSAI